MSEKVLIENCSPTMAGLKTGSLFSCEFKSREELFENVRSLNVRLVPRGVRMVPVKFMGNRVLIYMYRPKKLSKDLCDSTALSILSTKLYPTQNVQSCVAELIKRLNTQEEFPHEIGFWAILRSMLKASSKTRPRAQSALEPGRFTAMKHRPKENLRFTKNVKEFMRRPIKSIIHLIGSL